MVYEGALLPCPSAGFDDEWDGETYGDDQEQQQVPSAVLRIAVSSLVEGGCTGCCMHGLAPSAGKADRHVRTLCGQYRGLVTFAQVLHVPQGLPEDAKESDLAALFEPVGGIREIRLPREPGSQHCKGFAFLVRHNSVILVHCVWAWPCAVWIRQAMPCWRMSLAGNHRPGQRRPACWPMWLAGGMPHHTSTGVCPCPPFAGV